MSKKNQALARQIIEKIFCAAANSILAMNELVSPKIIIHDTDKELTGLDQLRQGMINLHNAFPDLRYTIEDLLSDGDKVIARCKGEGTHNGSFRGIAATGKKMMYTVILIWRFEDDKLIEHWSVSDVYGMLQQLDVITLKS